MSEEPSDNDPSIPDYITLNLKILEGHLGESTLVSDEPNMWLKAETDGHYSLNLGDGRFEQLGGDSPNCLATISVHRSVKGLPYIMVEKHKDSFVLRILSTCEDKSLEELASSIRNGNIPAYANFDLSPNPYISELTWGNPLPITNWRNQRSDPMLIHKQVFTYKSVGTLLEKFSLLSDQISSVENQLAAVKKETQEWRKEVAFDFNVILCVAIIFALIFSAVR